MPDVGVKPTANTRRKPGQTASVTPPAVISWRPSSRLLPPASPDGCRQAARNNCRPLNGGLLPLATSCGCSRAVGRYLLTAQRNLNRHGHAVKKCQRMAHRRPAVGSCANSCHTVKLLFEEMPTAGTYNGTELEAAPTAASDTSR